MSTGYLENNMSEVKIMIHQQCKKCEEFFGSRKEGLGVPQLNEKSMWHTKSAYDDFWK